METFVKGDVVITSFPYADFSEFKNRPALVVANQKYDDVILCQITSRKRNDTDAIVLRETDLSEGTLVKESFAIPSFIFTADISLIKYKIGKLKESKIKEVQDKLYEIFTRRYHGN